MYHFGENNVYHQVSNARGTKLRTVQVHTFIYAKFAFCTTKTTCFQIFFKRYMGFSPPLFQGRGIFNYTFGLLPYRSPINTVCKFRFVLVYTGWSKKKQATFFDNHKSPQGK
jgi:hypothetical protein